MKNVFFSKNSADELFCQLPLERLKKIALVRRNGLGDLLCSYPLIKMLKNRVPHLELTLFADESNAALLPYLPGIDHIEIFGSNGNKYQNILGKALSYRFKFFDAAISCKTSPMKLMNLFLYALGAKYRVALCDEKWHSHLVNCSILFDAHYARAHHQALQTLHMLFPYMNEVPKECYPQLVVPQYVKDKYQKEIDELLQRSAFREPTAPLLIMSASTSQESNALDPTLYGSLVAKLLQKFPLRVVVVSLPKDAERAHQILSALPSNAALFFPSHFDALVLLLQKSHLLFVSDGGMAHMAAALNKPLVVMYGQSNPRQWRPLGQSVTTFFHPLHVNYLNQNEIYAVLANYCKEQLQSPQMVRC